MALLVQLILLLILLYISYNVFSKDIFSPTVLIVSGYIITTIFAIYNLERWHSKISILAVLFILTGVTIFFVVQLFWKRVNVFRKDTGDSIILNQLKVLNIHSSKLKLLIAILVGVLATIILFREVTRIAYINYRDWGNLIYNYRQNRNEEQISQLARLLNYLTKSMAYVYLFLFINKITQYRKFKISKCIKYTPFLIPGLLFSIQSILLGGRIGILSYILAGVFIYSIIYKYKYNKTLYINILKVIKFIIAAVVICILFFKVQELIGRDQTEMSLLDYVATYLGGSMDLFSQYINNPNSYNKAHESFAGIINNLQNYLGMFKNINITISHEFRATKDGFVIGNTYTGFRNYYNDFGIFGIIFITVIFSSIFSVAFYYLKRFKRLNTLRISLIIIYSSEIYCLLFHFFCDYFLAGISINRMINYVMIWIVTEYVFGSSFKKKQIRLESR